jgi:S1-C subfamily serine protease
MFKGFCLVSFIFLLSTDVFAETSFIEKLNQAKDAIVDIKTVYTKTMKADNSGRVVSYERKGTGVVIDPSGVIVTNTHTIINAPHIFVIFKDGTKYEASVVFASSGYDFSLLKINAPSLLKSIAWADSSQIRLGQKIAVIGNSELDEETLLSGEISSIVRNRTTGENELIQMNLNLYKGDSGGPVFDEQRRLLGIVMAKEKSKERSSIAIASNTLRKQYVQYKKSLR